MTIQDRYAELNKAAEGNNERPLVEKIRAWHSFDTPAVILEELPSDAEKGEFYEGDGYMAKVSGYGLSPRVIDGPFHTEGDAVDCLIRYYTKLA